MESKIYINKNALNYFRMKARECTLEIHAYLVGEIHYPDTYVVRSIEHSRRYELQTSTSVQPSAEDYARIFRKAYLSGLSIIGDLHSHPNEDPIMSEPDYRSCMEDKLTICGIVGVKGQKTKVKFWLASSALPCEVVYKPYAETNRQKKRRPFPGP